MRYACGTAVCGIYVIRCTNGRSYVGSSTQLRARWRGHLSALRTQAHPNFLLQRDFAKLGDSAFTFDLLEQVHDVDTLLHIEQRYITQYYDYAGDNDTYRCYNLAKYVVQCMLGRSHRPSTIEKMKARVFTEEHRAKISVAKRGARNQNFGKSLSSAARAALSDFHTGRVKSPATRIKMRDAALLREARKRER